MEATSTMLSADVTDFVVAKGHGITGLLDKIALDGAVPEKYIQPECERLDRKKISVEKDIPIIDVSNWDDPAVSESICDAAEKRGFFQIINHGVALDVLENVQNITHKYFAQTREEKRMYLKENACVATTRVFLGTSFNQQKDQVLEWKDFLSLLYVPGDDDSSSCWPSLCRNEVLDYMKNSEKVIEKLLNILMKRLEVTEIDAAKRDQLMGAVKVNLTYYPICPKPELTAGVSRHCDVSSLTILLQDDTGGLYVRGVDGVSWSHVVPIPGSLVINVGDVLQIVSNGRYKSIEHYVMASPSKNRVSVPIFVHPGPDTVIAPFAQVLKDGQAPLYKGVIFSEYFDHFYNKGHTGNKTLESITF